jgi:hypothetical protein
MCYQVISLVRHEYAIEDVLNGIPGKCFDVLSGDFSGET